MTCKDLLINYWYALVSEELHLNRMLPGSKIPGQESLLELASVKLTVPGPEQ